uniref:Peptidase M50 domain-containing protein n=1 Tax=candidate division WWE3 bacterium TaxID=2053526 RepID=A0A832E0I7_UNCKA
MAVLGTILVLLAVMVVHEAGHFVLCLSLGIPVKSLHIGLPIGPQLRLRLGKYPFTISLALFGAAVMIDDEALWRAPLWKRILVFLAGPGANFLSVAVAGAIVSRSPAGFVGGLALVGFTAALLIKLAFAVAGGTVSFAQLASQTVGPVGIVALGSKMVSSGAADLFGLFTLVSTWLGLFNLLPIPGLDGGQVAANILVSLGLPRRWAMIATYISLGFLLVFMFVITARDVTRLF